MSRAAAAAVLALLLALGAAGAAWAEGAAAAVGAAPAAAGRVVQVRVRGGTVPCAVAGEGPAVMLLHGLFAQKEQWDGLSARLAASGRLVVAPDLPGFGATAGFALADHQLERQADLVLAVADALGIPQFDLAGSSMGGAIAARMAAVAPGRVRSLAFLGSPLGIAPWAPGVRDAIASGVNPFVPLSGPQFGTELRLLLARPPALEPSAMDAAAVPYRNDERRHRQVWDIVNLYGDALRDPAFLPGANANRPAATPAYALWGDADRIFEVRHAAALRAAIPGIALDILPGGGHLPFLEDPDAVAARYLSFLARAAARVSGTTAAQSPAAPAAPAAQNPASAYGGGVSSRILAKSTVTSAGAPIDYPDDSAPGGPRAEVTIAEVRIAPGAETGWHLHDIPVYAVVVSGRLEVIREGGASSVYEPGQAIVEMVGIAHNGRVAGAEPVVLHVVYTGMAGMPLSRKQSP